MAKSKTNKGFVDTRDMPRGRPSGVASGMSISVPLESGVDISHSAGPPQKNPRRGLRPPALGPHRPK